MSDSKIEVKAFRNAITSIDHVEGRLYTLAATLHRIYYKSKAQHRRAKWFQSMDALRKCFGRLLDMSDVTVMMDESLPDRGVSKRARAIKRRKTDDGSAKKSSASLAVAKAGIRGVLSDGLEGDPVNQETTLVSASRDLLTSCIQMEELVHRSLLAFNLLQIHLRTPPAPTFAPLIMSLLSLCAQIRSFCIDALWNEKSLKKGGLAITYNLLRAASTSPSSSSASHDFVLDRTSRSNQQRWQKLLNLMQSGSITSCDTWLPTTLTRSDQHLVTLPALQTSTQVSDITEKSNPLALKSTFTADDEDLGEAI